MPQTKRSLGRDCLWAVVWLASTLIVSLFIQNIAALCWAHLSASMEGRPISASFIDGLSWTFTNFWNVSQSWQGPGTIPMTLLILFGMSAGLVRHKGVVKVVPMVLGAMTLVFLLIYLSAVTRFGDHGFWHIFIGKMVAIAFLVVAGIGLDGWLMKYARPYILAEESPKLIESMGHG